jgi:hypothetical protein
MLEQSLRKLFEQQAEEEPPPGLITVGNVLRQGRSRRRRHRIGATGAPVLAAVAVAAIALTGTLPSGTIGRPSPPAGYGRLVGGAFDPSYLSIKFGWLPKGIVVAAGGATPGEETLTAYSKTGGRDGPEGWALDVYARNACHIMTAERQLRCWAAEQLGVSLTPEQFRLSITGDGPVINGHRSLFVHDSLHPFNYPPNLAWEYAPGAWAFVEHVSGKGSAATAARIARAAQYGQHIPVRFPSRFTSLPRGWRIVGLWANPYSRLPAGGYLDSDYLIARLRTIGPLTLARLQTVSPPGLGVAVPNVPYIEVGPTSPGNYCTSASGTKTQRVTIHGYRFISSVQSGKQFGTYGHVLSFLEMCGYSDGLQVNVGEVATGAHPHLALSPLQVMERTQLLGPKPSHWVTNPLP